MSQRPDPQQPTEQPPRRNGPKFPVSLIVIILLLLGIYMLTRMGMGSAISYSDFLALTDAGKVSRVVIIGNERLNGELRDPKDGEKYKISSGRFTTNLPKTNDVTRLSDRWATADVATLDERTKQKAAMEAANEKPEIIAKMLPPIDISSQEDSGAWVGPLILAVVPVLLILGIIFFVLLPRMRDPMGGNFMNNYVKSPARRYEKGAKARTTFADVAGMDNAKSELQEIVEFLKDSEKFQRLGAVVPKGVLLVGPPGIGKTLLARAVAGEANVPFFSINGSEFIQMFVGVGASRVRDMFRTAKESAPCLVFIDEIDAVGRMRGAGVGGGSDEREQTLNQILSEMDGFQPNETIIVIAATNRPDVLDAALLRPGRFDRHITVEKPTWQGRLAILKVHTRNKPLADNVDLEMIARKLVGMTGAELRNLCNEAALLATRLNKNKIEMRDFEDAIDRVIRGPKREEILTDEAKRRIAYHEAGHALLCWLDPQADKPLKVSIIPRGQSAGVNISLPDEDRFHHGSSFFKARLLMTMGGRAADRLVFGEPDAGAEMDIKQATRLARYMVTHWGMSDRLGPMSFRVGEEHVFLGKEISESRDFSEGTAQIIDEEVQKLLREADERAFHLLSQHRGDLDKIVEGLLKHEELNREEIEKILNPDGPPPPVKETEPSPMQPSPIFAPGGA